MSTAFSAPQFLIRFLVANILVLLTFNPSGYSFYHWVSTQAFIIPILALMGITLLIGWAIFLRATLRSLGLIGITLACALFACLAWIAIYYQLLTIGSTLFIYIILLIIAAILAIGVSWSHIRRRISGQVDTDDVDG